VCVLPVNRIPKPDIPDSDMCVFYLYIEYLSQIFLILKNTHISGLGIFGLGILYTGKTHKYQDQEYLASVFYIQLKYTHTRIRNIWLRYSIYR
jgi:hypothetical protein